MILRKLDAFTLLVFAFLVRLFSLFYAGGFDSVLGYDDGVYYSASTALNQQKLLAGRKISHSHAFYIISPR